MCDCEVKQQKLLSECTFVCVYAFTSVIKDIAAKNLHLNLGAVHKLHLQEEGVGGQKNRLLVNFYTVENVNGGGYTLGDFRNISTVSIFLLQ